VNDVVQALAAALAPIVAEIPELQITAGYNELPTPPSIDIYPAADTFLERSAMGVGSWEAVWVIRARVSVVDSAAGQQALLKLMDPRDTAASVIVTLESDPTLGGTVQDCKAELPSGFGEYADPASTDGRLLGCVWRARTVI